MSLTRRPIIRKNGDRHHFLEGKWSQSPFFLTALLILPLGLALAEFRPIDPPNKPIGVAKGIFPGRVVWAYDPNVAKWDGNTGHWYDAANINAPLAERMLVNSLRWLTGTKTDPEAWTALFTHYNSTHGRGEAGYKPGEKIAVKLNFNTSAGHKPTDGCWNTVPVTMALVRQLVNQAGVKPEDITLYDASRGLNDLLFNACQAEFPGVRFEDRDGNDGRFKAEPDRNVAIHFADPNVPNNGKTYLPTCVTGATYLINAAVLKGHDLAGLTLCAKNHFGSVFREVLPKEKDWNHGWDPGNMHESIDVHRRPMGTYNALVDLMGHKDLGGKTILYLADGIYAAPRQGEGPARWKSLPFNNGWTASLLASQDPVAIESVAVDFLRYEIAIANMTGAVDNYLHEAALADNPPSKSKYDPDGSGVGLKSLGVHEHWNSPEKKQYSRNLHTGLGIELITSEPR